MYLMRHAHYVGHRPGHHAPDDVELSPEGRRDTVRVAQRIPDVVGIVASPLRRAQQTAELLAEYSGIPLLDFLSDLREWRSPTAVQGIPPKEFPADYATWRAKRLVDPANSYGDGESLMELGARATRVRARLIALAGSRGPVLVVAHKILLRVLMEPDAPMAAFAPETRDQWPFLGLRTFG
ncbi:histidine phosphatase family protein [Nocardiopsis kunsanensis]|uniref:histidine phosphatase family protein n=1 Tax=Nocardiopsis kunsanensis TaxID=141693 RepID=UPI00037967A5|nr:histidine phosphatase family protein [Nocardiopsis kunsanensis]